jgi:hypothetical protein
MTLTFPPGPLTPLQGRILVEGTDENLWVTSADGSITFYLKGGFAPVAPGLPGQDGIIVQSIEGLSPPFKHKDLQAATQDGVTWTDTVYDPAMITIQGEMHASTPQALSILWDAWTGMWNPREPVTMEYLTPDGGFWYAYTRLAETWKGPIKNDRRYLYRPFVHKCRIDDAFWRGPDSVANFNAVQQFTSFGEYFASESGSLGGSWVVTYSGGHTGSVALAPGIGAYWSDTGNTTQVAECIYTTSTSTDYQVISIQMSGYLQGFTLGGYNDIWGRLDGSGNGVLCRFNQTGVWVYRSNSSTLTLMYAQPLIYPPQPGEWFTFIVGAQLDNPRSYALARSYTELFNFAEYGTGSVVGSTARGVGFGMTTVGGTPMAVPTPVASFSASDNTSEPQPNFVELMNIGTEDGWPVYTLVGPGTFVIDDGPYPYSTGVVTIGPLAYGQVARVTTLPRLRSIVDVYNPGNNLYPLMSGRFRTPIPGAAMPQTASPVVIPVAINGGSASSQIIATLTPQRVYPA